MLMSAQAVAVLPSPAENVLVVDSESKSVSESAVMKKIEEINDTITAANRC